MIRFGFERSSSSSSVVRFFFFFLSFLSLYQNKLKFRKWNEEILSKAIKSLTDESELSSFFLTSRGVVEALVVATPLLLLFELLSSSEMSIDNLSFGSTEPSGPLFAELVAKTLSDWRFCELCDYWWPLVLSLWQSSNERSFRMILVLDERVCFSCGLLLFKLIAVITC